MSDKEKLTDFSSLGEFGLIEHLAKFFSTQNTKLIKGIGDDSAVFDAGTDEYILLTTDQLIEGIHFDLSYTPLKHLGYKSVIVNLSDIYAMNGRPHSILVSVAVSNHFSLEAVEELYQGVKLACEKYNVNLAGGDTSSSRTGLYISITAIGSVKKEKICYRSGAKPNDLVCVTGDLGAAYAGLQILEREKRVFVSNPNAQPDLSKHSYVVGRQLKPEAQRELIDWLEKGNVIPTAMIDISDGLASELLHICKESKTGVKIFEEKIPVHDDTFQVAHDFQMDTNTFAFNGGEDYEMLFTVPVSLDEKIKENPYVCIIGHITDSSEGANLIIKNGTVIPIAAQGWNHFR